MKGHVEWMRVYWITCCRCEGTFECSNMTAAACRKEAVTAGWQVNQYGGWICPDDQ